MDMALRSEYWNRFEFSVHPEPENVLIARIGSLYAAYIALHVSGEIEQQIQPRFEDTPIASLLLERAGIVLAPTIAEEDFVVA